MNENTHPVNTLTHDEIIEALKRESAWNAVSTVDRECAIDWIRSGRYQFVIDKVPEVFPAFDRAASLECVVCNIGLFMLKAAMKSAK